MKLTAQQLLLPALIGFSLTGVSVVLLYLFTKKDEDDATKRRKTYIETSRQSEIQLKVPRQFVPAVIGRGGSVIKGVQQDTETQIKFKEETDIEAPERICIIRGKPECIRLAEAMLLTIINNQPIIETETMVIPQKAVGRIMGKGGESIIQIQNASSAKIILDAYIPSNDPNVERRLTIKGTAEQIATARNLIADKVKEEKEEREKLESITRQPPSKISPRSNEVQNENAVEETRAEVHAESNNELIADSLPIQDGAFQIYVSGMESPSRFWVQVYGSGTLALDKLVLDMTKYYENETNAELHALKKVTVGQIVAAKFGIDDRWYRSEILSGPDEYGCYEVFFIDFGDRESIAREHLLELRTDFLSLRPKAIECTLANLKPRGGDEWSDDAYDKFIDFTYLGQWRVLYARVKGYKERATRIGSTRREGSPIPCIEIYDIVCNEKFSLGKQMIILRMAQREEKKALPAASSGESTDPSVQSGNSSKDIHEIDPTTPKKGDDLKIVDKVPDLIYDDFGIAVRYYSNGQRAIYQGDESPPYNIGEHVSGHLSDHSIVSEISEDSDFEIE